jgi:hypothetical protein
VTVGYTHSSLTFDDVFTFAVLNHIPFYAVFMPRTSRVRRLRAFHLERLWKRITTSLRRVWWDNYYYVLGHLGKPRARLNKTFVKHLRAWFVRPRKVLFLLPT